MFTVLYIYLKATTSFDLKNIYLNKIEDFSYGSENKPI